MRNPSYVFKRLIWRPCHESGLIGAGISVVIIATVNRQHAQCQFQIHLAAQKNVDSPTHLTGTAVLSAVFFASVSFLPVVASVGSFVRVSPMTQTTKTLSVTELS
jgi:hypothetical protein